MSSIEIGTNQALIIQAWTDAVRRNQEPRRAALEKTGDPGGNAVMVDKAAQGGAELGRMRSINDARNSEAAAIRIADQKLVRVNAYVERMKDALFRIIKNYPPYPPDSAERLAFLRSFNGLRREIEAMIIPPTEKWTGYHVPSLVSEPVKVPDAVRATLPSVPESASDADLLKAAEQLDAFHAAVETARTEISAGAAAGGARTTEAKAAEIRLASGGDVEPSALQDAEAEPKSMELKTGLSGSAHNGMTQMQPQLAQLVG